MAHRDVRDFGFFQWLAIGFMLSFGLVAILSIGGPFIVLGLVLLGVMLGRGPRWPAGLGALAGVGTVGMLIGSIGSVPEPGLWLGCGTSLLAVATGAFWWLRCRPVV